MDGKFLMNHIDSMMFKNLCKEWVKSVRAKEDYTKRKTVEMSIIELAPTFGLDVDEVMHSLYQFSLSNERIEE